MTVFCPVFFQSKYMIKEWNPKHKPLLAQAVRDLADYDNKHPIAANLTLVCVCIYYCIAWKVSEKLDLVVWLSSSLLTVLQKARILS